MNFDALPKKSAKLTVNVFIRQGGQSVNPAVEKGQFPASAQAENVLHVVKPVGLAAQEAACA
jgi:hypothetical protein